MAGVFSASVRATSSVTWLVFVCSVARRGLFDRKKFLVGFGKLCEFGDLRGQRNTRRKFCANSTRDHLLLERQIVVELCFVARRKHCLKQSNFAAKTKSIRDGVLRRGSSRLRSRVYT